MEEGENGVGCASEVDLQQGCCCTRKFEGDRSLSSMKEAGRFLWHGCLRLPYWIQQIELLVVGVVVVEDAGLDEMRVDFLD